MSAHDPSYAIRAAWEAIDLLRAGKPANDDDICAIGRAAALRPADPLFARYLFYCFLDMNDLDNTEAAMPKAMALNPDNPAVLERLADFWFLKHMPDEACLHADRAIALHDVSRQDLIRYKTGMQLVAQARFEQARTYLLSALSGLQNEHAKVNALYYIGECGRRAGDLTSAIEFFQRAAQKAPNWAYPRIGISRIALEHGDAPHAIESAREAFDLAVSNSDLNTLAAAAGAETAAWRAGGEHASVAEIEPLNILPC